MTTLTQRIRDFWSANPCGTTHFTGLEPGSREYFEAFDPYYEDLYPYLLPFLDVESMRDQRIMEIGLGSGFTLGRFARVARECIGLDASIGTIHLNQRRDEHFGLGLRLINASATDIPLPDNYLDQVVSIGCLHHIPEVDRAVSEIHRVLKPGGVFKGMVYYKNSFRFRAYIPLQRKFGKWRGRSWQECVNEMYDGAGNPYGMVYSRRDVREMFGQFREIQTRQENFDGAELSPRLAARIPRRVWIKTLGRVAGLDLYFTARK